MLEADDTAEIEVTLHDQVRAGFILIAQIALVMSAAASAQLTPRWGRAA